jgi:hypothetical protein
VASAACGGYVCGVARHKCVLVRILAKDEVDGLRLIWANDAAKVGDVLRRIDLDDDSRCHLL